MMFVQKMLHGRSAPLMRISVAALFAAVGLLPGCATSKTETAAPAKGDATNPVAQQPGTVVPTAEQEAAKAQAIKDGPAIEAALQQQQSQQPQ